MSGEKYSGSESKQELEEYKLNMQINSMGLSDRSYNLLDRADIKTLRQITQCASTDLLNIRNFGPNQVEEVREKLHEIGLKLLDESE